MNLSNGHQIASALRAAPIFEGLSADEVEALVGAMEPRRFDRSDVILKQGDAPGGLHVVCQGAVKISIANADGKETLLAIIRPWDLFGEIAALDGGPRSATVTAIEQTETAFLARSQLLGFVRSHPDFALRLIETLAARLRRVDERLEDAHFLDLDTRFARLLLDLANEQGQPEPGGIAIRLRLTQSELASMIGATRVSANRLLGAYQDAGILRLVSGALLIVNREALRIRAGR
jgi:CRP/FNR family cyclic AMP-dependent transcriptional regulator